MQEAPKEKTGAQGQRVALTVTRNLWAVAEEPKEKKRSSVSTTWSYNALMDEW